MIIFSWEIQTQAELLSYIVDDVLSLMIMCHIKLPSFYDQSLQYLYFFYEQSVQYCNVNAHKLDRSAIFTI